LETIAQNALDIFREISRKQDSATIYVYCAVPELVSAGMTHYDADRAYALLKRLELVRSVQRVHGNRYYYLDVSPIGTVAEKAIERNIKNAQNAALRRKSTRRVLLLQQIVDCESRLVELKQLLAAQDSSLIDTHALPTN